MWIACGWHCLRCVIFLLCILCLFMATSAVSSCPSLVPVCAIVWIDPGALMTVGWPMLSYLYSCKNTRQPGPSLVLVCLPADNGLRITEIASREVQPRLCEPFCVAIPWHYRLFDHVPVAAFLRLRQMVFSWELFVLGQYFPAACMFVMHCAMQFAPLPLPSSARVLMNFASCGSLFPAASSCSGRDELSIMRFVLPVFFCSPRSR